MYQSSNEYVKQIFLPSGIIPSTVFAQKIEFYRYCLFWLVTLKAPSW